MSIHKVKLFTIMIIISSLLMSTISFIKPQRVSAETKYGNYMVYHQTEDGNVFHREPRPPVTLDSSGKGSAIFKIADKAGYNRTSVRFKNQDGSYLDGSYDKGTGRVTVNLTESNTLDNVGIIYAIYEKAEDVITANVVAETFADGADPYTWHNTNTTLPKGKEASIKAPDKGANPWILFDVLHDGSSKGAKDPYNFTPTKDTKLRFQFKDSGSATPRKVIIYSMAVGVDEDWNIIRMDSGNWELDRKTEEPRLATGTQHRVNSPFKNGIPEKYKDFKFAGIGFDAVSGGEHGYHPGNPPTMDNAKAFNSESTKVTITGNRNTYYVYYIYKKGKVDPPKPPDSGELGKIIFEPHETRWTNAGKTSNGSGSYGVTVRYTGSETITKNASYTWTTYSTDDKGNTTSQSHSGTFTVTWKWEKIVVSGATNTTVNGLSGPCNIEQEGYQQHLKGVGNYGAPQYSVPSPCDSYSLPDDPPLIYGESGYYDIDWTDPTCYFNVKPKIFNEENGARRGESKKGTDQAYFGTLTSRDNLSGVSSIDVGWTFGNKENMCKYENIYSNPGTTGLRSDEVIDKEIEKPVGDDLYLHVKMLDIAGNTNYNVYGPYEDPIMLKNFRITDIKDPVWDVAFWKDWEKKLFKEPTGLEYKANKLPVDNNSHPQFKDYYTKKGYAFYFDITSEYLYRDYDKIVITPTFYALDEKANKREEVDVYYLNGENPFTKIKSSDDKTNLKMNVKNDEVSIGSCSELTLTKRVRKDKGRQFYKYEDGWEGEVQYNNGKLQTWFGKYYIPATSIYCKKGVSPRPENLIEDRPLLVQFKITAYKNGAETNSTSQVFNYIPQQWKEEGGAKDKIKYKEGDIILYDKRRSTLDDFGVFVTH